MVFDMANSEHVIERAAPCDDREGVGALHPGEIDSGGPGGKIEVGRARWCSPLPISSLSIARLNFCFS